MHIFKKIIIGVIMFGALLGTSVGAVDIGIDPAGNGMVGDVAKNSGFSTQGVTDTTLSETVGRIIKIALSLLGTIFLALMVYAGFLWTTASGNDEQVTKATGIIKSAVIGLVVVLAAYGLTVFVMIGILSSTGANAGGVRQAGFWSFFKSNWTRFAF